MKISNCRNTECQDELAKWNLKVDVDLIKFEARVLDAEHILYFDVKYFSLFYLFIFKSIFLAFYQIQF
jgi:hypothetical protein